MSLLYATIIIDTCIPEHNDINTRFEDLSRLSSMVRFIVKEELLLCEHEYEVNQTLALPIDYILPVNYQIAPKNATPIVSPSSLILT